LQLLKVIFAVAEAQLCCCGRSTLLVLMISFAVFEGQRCWRQDQRRVGEHPISGVEAQPFWGC
jgi:hypothetical protein